MQVSIPTECKIYIYIHTCTHTWTWKYKQLHAHARDNSIEKFTEDIIEFNLERTWHLICDVSAKQHPDCSTTLWTMDLQFVLRIISQAVSILHWTLFCIPSTRSNADTSLDQQDIDLHFENQLKILHAYRAIYYQ